MANAAFFLNGAFSDALAFELFGGKIILSGFGIVIIIVVLVVILPGGVVAFPLVVNGGLVDGGVFERAGGCGSG